MSEWRGVVRRLLLLDGLPDIALWVVAQRGRHQVLQFRSVCIPGRGMERSGTNRKGVGEHGADGMRGVCHGKRQRRNRLIEPQDPRIRQSLFIDAPYVHQHDEPTSHALLLRAVESSKGGAARQRISSGSLRKTHPRTQHESRPPPRKRNAHRSDGCNTTTR